MIETFFDQTITFLGEQLPEIALSLLCWLIGQILRQYLENVVENIIILKTM